MKLKEFDFDYPYEKNEDYIQSLLDDGYEYLQATKKDYEKKTTALRNARLSVFGFSGIG